LLTYVKLFILHNWCFLNKPESLSAKIDLGQIFCIMGLRKDIILKRVSRYPYPKGGTLKRVSRYPFGRRSFKANGEE